ncbi:MAG: hypothetical protein ACT4O5_04640 [Gammaproteobacteria bacterium]
MSAMFHSVQSALDPAGRGAGRMGELVRAVMLGCTLVSVVAVLLYVLIIGEAFSRDASHEPLRIEVTARRSWWEVRYAPQAADRVLANELRVPVGRPVEVVLSADSNPESRTVLTVIAEESVDFDEWLARQSAPSVTPTDPTLQDGRAAFFRGGCDACHAIRGTAARGRAGPDLTHVGTRGSLASDALDGHLRAARDSHVANRELRAIAAYLASLK